MARLRDDLLVFPASDDEDALFVQDRHTCDVHKFSSADRLLLEAIRHPDQADQLLERSGQQLGRQLGKDDLAAFSSRLWELGLLESTLGGPGDPPFSTPADRSRASQQAHTEAGESSPGRTLARRSSQGELPRRWHDPGRRDRYWHLLQPEPLLDQLVDWLGFTRYLVFLLPPMLALTLVGLLSNWDLARRDLALISLNTNLLQHLLLSLLTTNLTSQVLKGAVARHFGFAVPGLRIRLLLGVVPRFSVYAVIPDDASKTSKMWLAGTGLLARLILACLGFLLWIVLRPQGSGLSLFGLALTLLSLISLLFVANPLMGSSGYQLLSTYADNPGLRNKALLALRYRGRVVPESVARYVDKGRGVRLYAWGSVIFAFGFIGFVVFTLAAWLALNYGGLGVMVVTALAIYLFFNLSRRFALLRPGGGQPRASMSLPPSPPPGGGTSGKEHLQVDARPLTDRPKPGGGGGRPKGSRWRKPLVWAMLGALLLLPYRYEAGGDAVILPRREQQIFAQYPGVIERVFFDGGELVERGTILAEMSSLRESRDVEVTRSLIAEQEQRLKVLESTPTAEQVLLAQETLKTAHVKVRYSEQNAERIRKVYQENGISFASYEEALKGLDVARQEAAEQAASLEALIKQINPSEIKAAKAKIEALHRELDYYEEVLQRTKLHMPFDGRITTMHLRNLENKFLEDGDLFAQVQDTETVIAEISIPESEMRFVRLNSPVRVKLHVVPSRLFSGKVSVIAPTTEEITYGRVVKVYCVLDNPDQAMKPGMTGYAKVGGEEMLAAEAFTMALIRFLRIEAWSWLP